MKPLEALTLLAGAIVVTSAFALVDPRLGLLCLGLFLLASVVDLPRRRT